MKFNQTQIISSKNGKWEDAWKDIEDKITDGLNSCLSLKKLSKALTFYKSLIIEINQSRIFFHCENGFGKTKIAFKLLDGTEFMNMLIDDSIDIVPEDMQGEILEFLLKLCEKAIKCINERIPIVEKTNRIQGKKYALNLIIFVTLGVFLSAFHTNIAEKIIESVNVNGIDLDIFQFVINTVLEFLGLAFLIKAGIIPLQYILSEYVEISTGNSNEKNNSKI